MVDVTALPNRTVADHHDGHGLNESIVIETDQPDAVKGGNAPHYYYFAIGDMPVGEVQFQHGPRLADDSTPGVTEAAIIAMLIDRLRGFQSGPFACRENAIILTKLEECLMWTKERAHARARRGVLGKNEK